MYHCQYCEATLEWLRRRIRVEATVDYSLDGNGGDHCTDLGCCVSEDGDHTIPSYDDDLDEHHLVWECTECGAEQRDLDDLVHWRSDDDDDEDDDHAEGDGIPSDATATQRLLIERRRAKGLS